MNHNVVGFVWPLNFICKTSIIVFFGGGRYFIYSCGMEKNCSLFGYNLFDFSITSDSFVLSSHPFLQTIKLNII